MRKIREMVFDANPSLRVGTRKNTGLTNIKAA
jgi:hypothetical protein